MGHCLNEPRRHGGEIAAARGLGYVSMKFGRQTTLGSQIVLQGVGVHSGMPASVTLAPADANTGILFVRTGLEGADREVRAEAKSVIATDFATVLGDRDGPLVSTAEHVLAALRGMSVDNVIVEVDGPEVPILDGSAGPFVDAIDRVGVVQLSAGRRFIEVLRPVRVTLGECFGEVRPYSHGFRAEVEIEFDHPMIGYQALALDVDPTSFRRDVARARTFGRMSDVAKLWKAGYARGASFDNSIVIDDTRVLNADGLRYVDEFVRHKTLDAIGDLALSGLPMLGAYRSLRGGHKLNHAVLTALLADRAAWRLVEAEATRRRGHADIVGIPAPAYAPERS